MSLKSTLIILWGFLIAGAAVASENQRLCDLHAHTEIERLHEYLQLHDDEFKLLIVAEVDVTN